MGDAAAEDPTVTLTCHCDGEGAENVEKACEREGEKNARDNQQMIVSNCNSASPCWQRFVDAFAETAFHFSSKTGTARKKCGAECTESGAEISSDVDALGVIKLIL
jgi:hypothetical protein